MYNLDWEKIQFTLKRLRIAHLFFFFSFWQADGGRQGGEAENGPT